MDDCVINGDLKSFIWNNLSSWIKNNYQKYPWREKKDPYFVFISEFMLRRTNAKQVEKVYPLFIKRYPSIEEIAKSSLDEILPFFKNLGLVFRAKLLLEIAKQMMKDSVNWSDTEKLKSYKGIGDYIVTAIKVFAFEEKGLVLDSNTGRWINRFFDLKINSDFHKNRKIQQIAKCIAPDTNYRILNYGLLDFTMLVCKPTTPICNACVIRKKCKFYNRNFDSKKKK